MPDIDQVPSTTQESPGATSLLDAIPSVSTTLPDMQPIKDPKALVSLRAEADRVVAPDESLNLAMDQAPPGSVFFLTKGVHRGISVVPRDGDVFVGEPGTVVSGAQLLLGSVRDGRFWRYPGQTQEGRRAGNCAELESGEVTDSCRYPEDLYIDDQLVRRVSGIADLEPGRWYFDYDNDEVWIADDPQGRKIELSSAMSAFRGSAVGVEIRGFVIEKYANPAQVGAIQAISGEALSSEWLVEDCEIRLNHGLGIRTGNYMTIRRNYIHSNGQLGMGGAGNGILVEGNEIARNNTAGFSFQWEAGGAKFLFTRDLTVRWNYVHNNVGPGLWTDTDNMRTHYEGNYVVDNAGPGIFHEISFDAEILNNVIVRNGFGFSRWLYGAGILVAGSQNVHVSGNQVFANANGITGIDQGRGESERGKWELRNLVVDRNVVGMEVGLTGLATDVGASIFEGRGNRFADNIYVLSDESRFSWAGAVRSVEEWQSYGQDIEGVFYIQP